MSQSSVSAVLDVGSNTVRLLVARCADGELEPVIDRSEFVRLGKGVDKTGELAPERQEAGVTAIRRLAEEARNLGADSIVAIATSAIRDAANGEAFVHRVKQETGVPLEIITGDQEAELTFGGATYRMSLEGGVLVCDLGGGSAELIHATHAGIRWAVSRPLGSGRLTERYIEHDPPSASEVQAVGDGVVGTLRGLPEAKVARVVFTGGTASHIALLAHAEGEVAEFSPHDLDDIIHLLTRQPAEDIITAYGVQPERAHVLPAGAVALATIADFYRAEKVVITRRGIREGALLRSCQ